MNNAPRVYISFGESNIVENNAYADKEGTLDFESMWNETLEEVRLNK